MIDYGRLKVGYQGRDPMRENAEKLMKSDLNASKKDDFSPAPYSAPENTKMRPYKKGGHVDGAKHGSRIATDNHRPGLAKGKKVARPVLSTLSRKTGGAVQAKKGPAMKHGGTRNPIETLMRLRRKAEGGEMQAEKGPAKLKAGGHAHGGYSRMSNRQERPMMHREKSRRHESKESPRMEAMEHRKEKPMPNKEHKAMPRHMSHRAAPSPQHRKHIERSGKFANGGEAKQGKCGPAMKRGGEKVPAYGWGGSGKFVTGLKKVPILGQIANLIGLKQGGKVK